jgi:hypothetical protein
LLVVIDAKSSRLEPTLVKIAVSSRSYTVQHHA